jgi:hypothetical protein
MPSSRSRKILHIHNLHHQTRPPGKVLGTLTLACLRVVLLPRKTCVFPFSEDVLNQVFAKFVVDFGCLCFVGALGGCDFLRKINVNIL